MACNASCSPRTSFLGSSSGFQLGGHGRSTTRAPIKVRAVKAPEECNEEDCAPTKEVGKVSMEWLAEEKTKISGTFPPMTKRTRFNGYVEKDSAGQSNIYAVEPQVYVAESAISTGTAGVSSDGSDTTVLVVAGLMVLALAGAGVTLNIYAVKNATESQQQPKVEYYGPPLSYYVERFQPSVVSATIALEQVEAPALEAEVSAEPVEVPDQVTDEVTAVDGSATLP